MFKYLLQTTYWPVLVFGNGAGIVWLASFDAGFVAMFLLLLIAIGFNFLIEHLIPYQQQWNYSDNDLVRDILHATVNFLLNRASLWLLPFFSCLSLSDSVWPSSWPFGFQVLFAVILLDIGISSAHHLSHKFAFLWRFHAVHHSLSRLYGFNGLMKHPVHLGLEMVVGVIPLILLGIPYQVALTLPLLVSLALLGQHTNVDIRSGWLKFLFANAELHRFHHSNGVNGNVNFGLFTTLYDHLARTFFYQPGGAPKCSREIGIRGQPDYPESYIAQLLAPFRNRRL